MARTPIHPGEHLAEELKGLSISAAELSRQIDVPVNRITAIINGQRGVTADTALRLGHWFGTSPEFWLNLQTLYELRLARDELGDRVEKLPTVSATANHSRSGCPIMHVNKVHRVTMLNRVAKDLGENEDWLSEVANEMEVEDGVIWVDGVGDDGAMALTDFGIENLIDLIKMHKDDPTLLRRNDSET